MMSIVLVGGHDKMHSQYKNVASKHGHKVKVYTQLTAGFEKSIGHPDAIVLFTDKVSHKMVWIATKKAKKENIPIIRNHSSSISALESVLKNMEKNEKVH